MDLVLNNLQRFICHKTQQTNQLTNQIVLNFWGMQRNSSLPLFPGSLWLGVVAPDRDLSLGQIELNSVITLNWIVLKKLFFTFNCV